MPSVTDWISAISAGVVAVLTLFLAWFAWDTLHAAKRTLDATRAAQHQVREDSIERHRPYVSASVEPGLHGPGHYDLVLRNTGLTTARALAFDLEPWPDALDDVASAVQVMANEPRDLAPRTSIRTVWRLEAGEGRLFGDGTSRAGLPASGLLRLRYDSDERSRGTYTDRFTFDVERSGLWPLPESGSEHAGSNASEKELRSILRAIARHVGELRR